MKVKDREQMRRWRKRAKLTQYELAYLVKCTQATISALETGTMKRCSDDLATQIADRLNVDVEDLFEAHDGSRVHRVTNAVGSTRQPTPGSAA